MSIDFTLPPDVDEVRGRVREFMDEVVRPAEEKVYANAPNGEPDRSDIVRMIIELRQKAHEWNVWLPHMPKEWGGLGLGITAMAFVSAEAARTNFGPFLLHAPAPDAGPAPASNPAVLGDPPADGWEIVRDIRTMAGHGKHREIRIPDLPLPDSAILGGRGNGHLPRQARLGPARLAHCMRWIGQT